MTRFGWMLTLGVLILLCGGSALVWYLTQSTAPAAPSDEATTTPSTDLTGQAIYTNGTYGFLIQYPESAQVADMFPTAYHLPNTWRVNPVDVEATGTPVVSIVTYNVSSEHSYPRYYTAMVRIGVSVDRAEVAACEKLTPDRGETALPSVTMNGTTWNAFSFSDAAMMQYVKGVSYRVVHDGRCYALEKIVTGSSYRDDPDSPDDLPDTFLDAEYAKLDAIISSFTFAGP